VSVSCNGVWCPKTDTTGPSGSTENAVNAVTVEITGAKKKTTLSASFGTRSSLNASFNRRRGSAAGRTGRCGWAGPVLHPGHDAPLVPDGEQRHHDEEGEDRTTLMAISHHGSCPNWSRFTGPPSA